MDNSYKPCSHHTQKFVSFANTICQQEARSSANDFFHLRKFSQLLLNLKDAVENIWRPTIFYLATKVLCFVTAFLRRVISISRTWPITELEFLTGFYWHFWLYQKFRCMSQMRTRLQKRKIGDHKILCRRQTLIFVVLLRTGPDLH